MQIGGFGIERRKLFDVVEVADCRTESSDPGKLGGMGEADFETFKAAHGEADDGAIAAVFGDAVLGFNSGNDFGEESLGKEAGVVIDSCRVVPDVMASEEGHIAVAERHDDDHLFDLPCRKEVVKNEIGVADGTPSR